MTILNKLTKTVRGALKAYANDHTGNHAKRSPSPTVPVPSPPRTIPRLGGGHILVPTRAWQHCYAKVLDEIDWAKERSCEPDWQNKGSRIAVEAAMKALVNSPKKLATDCLQYLEHRASMMTAGGYPRNKPEHDLWISLGGRIEKAPVGSPRHSDPTLAVDEPQHPRERLRAFKEHGQPWVECLQCGRQWAIHGSRTELVSDGDGYCDENASESPRRHRSPQRRSPSSALHPGDRVRWKRSWLMAHKKDRRWYKESQHDVGTVKSEVRPNYTDKGGHHEGSVDVVWDIHGRPGWETSHMLPSRLERTSEALGTSSHAWLTRKRKATKSSTSKSPSREGPPYRVKLLEGSRWVDSGKSFNTRFDASEWGYSHGVPGSPGQRQHPVLGYDTQDRTWKIVG